MNTKPRNSNVTGILLLALFALALLAACSGGNIDVAIGGVSVPSASLPPFPNSEPVVAQGTTPGSAATPMRWATSGRHALKMRMPAGLFVAEQLLSGPALPAGVGQRVQVGGIVTRFASTADFEVNGIAASITEAPTFINGDSSDLRLNARVTIDGEFDTGSRVRAACITFAELTSGSATLDWLDGARP